MSSSPYFFSRADSIAIGIFTHHRIQIGMSLKELLSTSWSSPVLAFVG
jgi:hypothetical protein